MQISPPNFLVRTISVNGPFPRFFGRITQKYVFTENLLTRKLGRKAYNLQSEEYKQFTSKIYSFNNIPCRFTISFELCVLFQKLVKKGSLKMSH